MKSKYVNIVDFVEAKRRGQKIVIYETLPELRAYTKSTGSFFPLRHAKAGNILCGLLQHILDDPDQDGMTFPIPRKGSVCPFESGPRTDCLTQNIASKLFLMLPLYAFYINICISSDGDFR